jgi:hypothetical protein
LYEKEGRPKNDGRYSAKEKEESRPWAGTVARQQTGVKGAKNFSQVFGPGKIFLLSSLDPG